MVLSTGSNTKARQL